MSNKKTNKTIKLLLLSAVFTVNFCFSSWDAAMVTVTQSVAQGDNQTLDELADKSGRSFSVLHGGKLTENEMKEVIKQKDFFYSQKGLEIASMRFAVSDNVIEIIIVPAKYTLEGKDLTDCLPAGLFFILKEDALTYNFRFVKNKLFLNLKGNLLAFTDLEKKLIEAYVNPQKFYIRNDPDYILSKIDEHDEEIEQLRKNLDELTFFIVKQSCKSFKKLGNAAAKDIIAKILAAKKADPQAPDKALVGQLKTQGIKIAAPDLAIIFQYYKNALQ